MNNRYASALVMAAALAGIAAPIPSWSQEVRTEAPSVVDLRYMESARQRVDEIARLNLGEQLQDDANNLDLLQRILDQNLVQPGDRETLQAMGIVLGDQLRRDLRLNWIIYEDQLGRTRALEIPGAGEYLFPATMISRRVEVGASVDVSALYEKAAGIVEAVRSRSAPF